jgi:hypothetical protein
MLISNIKDEKDEIINIRYVIEITKCRFCFFIFLKKSQSVLIVKFRYKV